MGDINRYDSHGSSGYYNSSYNNSNGFNGNSSSPTDTLNALAAKYGIEAKFVVKEVEYLPHQNNGSSNAHSSASNSNSQYDANTGISNAHNRASQMTGYRGQGISCINVFFMELRNLFDPNRPMRTSLLRVDKFET